MMDRPDADELASIIDMAIALAHLEARDKEFSKEEQRAVWSDKALQKRMASVKAEKIEIPIELAELFVMILRGEPIRGRRVSATQRALKNLAKSTYQERLEIAKAAGVSDAKNVVLEGMAEQFGISPDRISQLVWPRRKSG